MAAPEDSGYLIPVEHLDRAIVVVRGKRVILSHDLAAAYGVTTKRLNEQVKRNIRRFPADFAFEVTEEEWAALRSQFATSNARPGRGGRRYQPYAFTEHGAVMAASVLNSDRAVEVSVFVVRAFVRMSQALASHRQLALKLAELEARVAVHDKSIQSLLTAIRSLITPPPPKKKRIGFVTDDDKPGQTGSGSDFVVRDRQRFPQTPHLRGSRPSRRCTRLPLVAARAPVTPLGKSRRRTRR